MKWVEILFAVLSVIRVIAIIMSDTYDEANHHLLWIACYILAMIYIK